MGIVPMKPPNRSHEVVAAEVVEGRPVTKENKADDITYPTLCGTTGAPLSPPRAHRMTDRSQGALLPPRFASDLALPQGASKVRTVCGSSRKHGSVRGVAGNSHPYRDDNTWRSLVALTIQVTIAFHVTASVYES